MWRALGSSVLLVASLLVLAAPRLAVVSIAGGPPAAPVAAAAAATARFAVQPGDVVVEALTAAREIGLDCAPADTPCWVKVGVSSEFDLLLIVGIERSTRGGRVAVARLVDASSGREAPRAFANLDGGDSERARSEQLVLADLARRAIDEAAGGSLAILDVDPRGARVLIDDVDVGIVPLSGPVTRLAVGRHRLVVGDRTAVSIEIRRGAVAEHRTAAEPPVAAEARTTRATVAELTASSTGGEPVADRGAPGLQTVALATAALGGLVALGSLVGAVVVEQDLVGRIEAAKRGRLELDVDRFRGDEAVQLVLVGSAVAGAGAAAVGVALLAE